MPEPLPPVPATGAWRDGDPPGDRRFVDLPGRLLLEAGGELPSVRVAYETWGTLSPRRDNAVLVLHALTGDSHLTGPVGPAHRAPGWWAAMVGPGRPLDPDRWFLVCPNVLGGCQGTTGPSSPAPDGKPWGSRFPEITVRDQVAVERSFMDVLGIPRWASVVGGSMGGMRALEWLIGHRDRVDSGLVLAVGAYSTADQIGLQTTQQQAILTDPGYAGGDYHDAPDGEGPHRGMGVARRIAHLSYRSEFELGERFGRSPQDNEDVLRGGRYAVQSYLDHHADKLARRFDAGSYMVLTQAMNTHDVGRDRGGVAAALGQIEAPVVVAGIDSDRLYPIHLQQEIALLTPTSDGLRTVRSPYGHDGFLVETEAVGDLLRETLDLAPAARSAQRDLRAATEPR
ncbi:MAG TPA: homoserine O-acetyltransferase [Mycobacteriales bacterium]|nr:homoserine O-acetyltransferase [Mycobacteriales bacterium]